MEQYPLLGRFLGEDVLVIKMPEGCFMPDAKASILFFSKENGFNLSTYWRNEETKGVIGCTLGIPFLVKMELMFGFNSPKWCKTLFKTNDENLYHFGFEFSLPFRSNLTTANCLGMCKWLTVFTWDDLLRGDSEVVHGDCFQYTFTMDINGKREEFLFIKKPYVIHYNRFYLKDEVGYHYEIISLSDRSKTMEWIDEMEVSNEMIFNLASNAFGG